MVGRKKEKTKMQTKVVAPQEAPAKVRFELVREVAGSSSPVIVKKKMIKKNDEIVKFARLKPLPRAYFVRSIIKTTKTVSHYLFWKKVVPDFLVRCNIYWGESLESLNQSKPEYSEELSNLLLSDDIVQHINGVAATLKFILDSTVFKLLLVVFVVSLPFGLLMDTILNLVPHQIVVWSP